MIHLEKINKNQLPIIKDLAYAIWPSAYGEILSVEQLNYMLDNFYSIESLENQMDKGQIIELLFEDNNIVGFVAYEFNCKETGLLKIHKIYLLPETQGKGFGKFMIDEVIKIAKSNHQKGVFLNVNKYNKAQFFYQKLGFSITIEEVIDIGNNYIMDDYQMELKF
ncbi:GNAT family N-acetyltransferase [Flavobacterium terrigena]|uniref:Ribosomal protein S18 acetylase RimI n=1 Tax=Flavobacterium terrigena TaxID=402734 RepID=A0A1H6S882_9FLAO|nr:GNAT family N-acetyltransferase [Flavobacterium terrigena]SEI60230.1 Ribosomal protein S18 acetylase RimI [Flavobacterium terrigena]